MTVSINPNDRGNPPGKLADAELHFSDGPLAGLKLIGFSIWERRVTDSEGVRRHNRTVTFPARHYSVNGERRSFALLRPTDTQYGMIRLRDLILAALADYEARTVAAAEAGS